MKSKRWRNRGNLKQQTKTSFLPGMYTMKHKKKTTNGIKLKSWFICLEKKTFINKPHMVRQKDNLSQHHCTESFATYRRAALVSLDGLEW